ncbi:MAG: hypothetical protein M1830_001872 [Pleopsidium flavum]|nr:MAG: hypothetical protein M1830_001872 [Pleopsidium flavum]
MKLSIFSLAVLLSVGLVSAAPSPGGSKSKSKGPPGPPSGTFGSASQSCSGSQSSIHCCNSNGGQGKSHGKNVFHDGETYNLVCSQINDCAADQPVQAICSTTVACCQGDGCVAIAN